MGFVQTRVEGRGLTVALAFLVVVLLGQLGCAGGEEETVANPPGTTPDAATDAPVGQDAKPDAKDAAPDTGGECVPKTCAQIEANCGTAPDGCGDVIECGDCPAGQQCGGGGTNKCGTDECTPKTCVQVAAQCGWASDGCAEAIDCGGCSPPKTCGGNGTQNVCGCTPKTCSQLGANCGTVPDGCSGTKDCGSCDEGLTCGGGGPNVCGSSECTPKTCSQVGASCGFVSDGCSEALDCGDCTSPDECGGGGVENQCGCTPKTCAQLGANCGTLNGGCGEIDCGECTSGDTCGGGGIENRCGCVCSAPNAVTTCVGGVCSIEDCTPGWGDCDGVVANGCETDVTGDINHCGSCTNVCGDANGVPACLSGVCQVVCNPGFRNCDNDTSNGCEADTQNDPVHCGYCNQTCSSNHVPTPTCENAECTGACEAGYADCNGNVRSDGCEVNIGSDAANCGGCGLVCSTQNVPAPSCSGGVCDGGCDGAFADCNGNKLTDGCETDTLSSPQFCGSCSTSCNSPMPSNASAVSCNTGTCQLDACSPSFYDQDQSFATGCECADDGVGDTCGGSGNLGTIGVSSQTMPSGSTYYTLVPTGDVDWYRGTFQAGTTCSQRPRVQLVDPSGLLRMRVYATQTCTPGAGAGYACTEGGTSADAGILEWEFGHSAACSESGTIDPTPAQGAYFQVPGAFLIEVFATGSSTACLPYQLAFTRS